MNLKTSLEIFEYLWKVEKVTVMAKQVIIKDLENKIIALSDKQGDSTDVVSILKEKENEIDQLRKQLNLPIFQPVHTPELRKS